MKLASVVSRLEENMNEKFVVKRSRPAPKYRTGHLISWKGGEQRTKMKNACAKHAKLLSFIVQYMQICDVLVTIVVMLA